MPKILIVEDNHNLNEAYSIILKNEKYDVYSAYDGEQALKVAEDINPDLILLDLRMPNVDGVEFLKLYKLEEKHPDVKVIVFTNLDENKQVESAFELGAKRYILKALASPQELVRIIEKELT